VVRRRPDRWGREVSLRQYLLDPTRRFVAHFPGKRRASFDYIAPMRTAQPPAGTGSFFEHPRAIAPPRTTAASNSRQWGRINNCGGHLPAEMPCRATEIKQLKRGGK
jgi:hypothetical protein